MTAFHPVASRSRDRTGVCCAGRSAPSQCEMVTGPAFSSPSQPDRERTTAYRDSSEPVSRSDAHCVTVVGDQEQPSGESRLTDLAVSDNAQPTFLRDHRMGTGHGEYASMVKIEALGDECLTSSFRNLFLSSLSPGSNRLLRVDIGVVTFTPKIPIYASRFPRVPMTSAVACYSGGSSKTTQLSRITVRVCSLTGFPQ